MILRLLPLVLLLAAPALRAQPADLARPFREAGVRGTFVLYDVARDTELVYNPARADSGFLPASTFKILNSLVALETGAVAGADETIAWDGTDRGWEAWNRDHNMRTAFPVSAVWFYQALARRIGEERMRRYVAEAGYGNADVDGGIDTFWLSGDLRVTPREQVDFLTRLHRGTLPFSARTLETVRDVMVAERTDRYVLRAKTGWAGDVGWYVGYVERDGNVYVFANQIEIRTDEDGPLRTGIAREILSDLGLIDRAPPER